MSLFIKRHQKIIKVENWRYYLEIELSSVKVALSIEWRCNSNVYGKGFALCQPPPSIYASPTLMQGKRQKNNIAGGATSKGEACVIS